MKKNCRAVAWLSSDTKEAFEMAAKVNHTTESKLLGLLIDVFLRNNLPGGDQINVSPVADEGIKEERVTARFTKKEHAVLLERAKSKGMSKAAFLAGLFRANISGEPYFSEEELLALRDSNRQLSALGRNINQIAKALHINPENANKTRALEYKAMHHIIEAHRKYVKELIKANLKTWGVEDDSESIANKQH